MRRKAGERHNGWANYETWACVLWFEEDGLYDELVGLAKELLTTHDEDDALYELMKTMESDVEEMVPDIPPGLYSDIMRAGIQRIDYYEIARHIIDDAKFDIGREVR
jgi:hypothetical protein